MGALSLQMRRSGDAHEDGLKINSLVRRSQGRTAFAAWLMTWSQPEGPAAAAAFGDWPAADEVQEELGHIFVYLFSTTKEVSYLYLLNRIPTH